MLTFRLGVVNFVRGWDANRKLRANGSPRHLAQRSNQALALGRVATAWYQRRRLVHSAGIVILIQPAKSIST